jgi:hypothetical protein
MSKRLTDGHAMKEIWFGHPEELAKFAAAVSHGKKPKPSASLPNA